MADHDPRDQDPHRQPEQEGNVDRDAGRDVDEEHIETDEAELPEDERITQRTPRLGDDVEET